MKLGKCVLCKKVYYGYGNNALPLKNGRCCEACNITKVIPARLNRFANEENPKC